MSVKEIFPGIYRLGGRLATRNYAPGWKVYGEELVRIGGVEYRLWDAYRSKLGGAIEKGLREMPIAPGGRVLYLGAASGTTSSHVSDIVGDSGVVVCVEFAPRPMRDLVAVCEKRPNMIPLLNDARRPRDYADVIESECGGKVDAVFEDVADPAQVEIMAANAKAFLEKEGTGLLALKSRSISGVGSVEKVYADAEKELVTNFKIRQFLDLAPFDKDHRFYALALK